MSHSTMTPPQVSHMSAGQSDPFTATATPDKSSQTPRIMGNDSPSALLTGSPAQARRVLEAHIADTDRRIQDASRLGTTLLHQKTQLADRLRDVESQRIGDTISPELQQKLANLEQEWAQVGRETARAFIPRSRYLSEINDTNSTPTVFGGDARSTPAKLSVPLKNKRATSANRVHDIEFATEISTSLLGQVRGLQAIIAEKEEALRNVHTENLRLQSDSNAFQARLRSLDEDEEKFKDENWNLETQLQDLSAQTRDALEREEKLTQALNATKAEKLSAQREFEDIKQSHDRLSDDHAALQKLHDTELNGLRHAASLQEATYRTLQRKIDELTSQNQELARAVAYRINSDHVHGTESSQAEDFQDDDNATPEHSPPPSPTKATPRHGGLEHETLKSSLTHAHRMIQNLKNNIHREKTEKLELRRMLQDTRDELEARQINTGLAANGIRRSKQASELKKAAQPAKLGGRKEASEEIWEEYEQSPTRHSASGLGSDYHTAGDADVSDTYATATENSDAYVTSSEKDNSTGTDAFATANSVAGDDSDDLTETEHGPSRVRNTILSIEDRPQPTNRMSFMSSASDEEHVRDMMTPPGNQQRYKLRLNRGGKRTSESPSIHDSPASFVSNNSQKISSVNLAAELGNFGDEDDDSVASNTPSRSIASRQASPQAFRSLASRHASPVGPTKPASILATNVGVLEMREIGTMTELEGKQEGRHNELSAATTAGVAPGGILGSLTGVIFGSSAESSKDAVDDADSNEGLTSAKRSVETPRHNGDTQATGQGSVIRLQPQFLEMSAFEIQQTMPLIRTVENAANSRSKADMPPGPPANEPRQGALGVQGSKPGESSTNSFGGRNVKPRKQKVMDNPFGVKAGGSPGPAILEDQYDTSPRNLGSSVFQKPSLQSRDHTQDVAGPPDRSPLRTVSGNTPDGRFKNADKIANAHHTVLSRNTSDEGSQTSLSAEQIDKMMKDRNRTAAFIGSNLDESPRSGGVGSSPPGRSSRFDAHPALRSPESASSLRKEPVTIPPLPQDARETIAAASRPTSSHKLLASTAGTVHSSPRQLQQPLRPRTPSLSNRNLSNPQSPLRATSTRTRVQSFDQNGNGEQQRRDSVSSFASELDERFNMPANGQTYNQGYDVPGTDPRMIAAITQTMIGEFLWKYTRKPGRGELSENRHRRFFWIHPYTRTLYWSTQDPGAAGRAELKAKSVPIEAVRVISDDNIVPPGLHSKSIVVVTPGRSIKFTAPTNFRHETWFNALSYLLLRGTGDQRQEVHQARAVVPNHERTATMDSMESAGNLEDFGPSRRSSSRLTTHSHRSVNSSSNVARASNAPNFSYRAPSPQGVRPSQSLTSRSGTAQNLVAASPVSGRTLAMQAQRATNTSSVASDFRGGAGEHAGEPGEFKKPALPRASVQSSYSQNAPRKPSSVASAIGTPSKSSSFASKISNSLNSIGRRGRQDSRAQDEERRREAAMEEAMDNSLHQQHQHGSGLSSQQQTPRKVENVRACCDGKHDVGHLHHRSTSRAASIASAGRRSLSLMGSRTQLGDGEH